MKINIPNPCAVAITKMKPADGGFHCSACAHTVIDFRDWKEEDIQEYLKKQHGKVCGIIKPEHHKPIVIQPKIDYSTLSWSQQFLCALFICFGAWLFGCGEVPQKRTENIITQEETPPKKEQLDTLQHVVGNFASFELANINDSLPEKALKNEDCIRITPNTETSEDDILKLIEVGNVQMKCSSENENLIFGTIEIAAKFPGGEKALVDFIQANLVYPEYEKQNQIEGIVYVKFTIDEEGNISNPRVIRGIINAPNLNDEAIRIVQLMPKWKPSTQGGIPVKMQFNLPIKFSLQ